MWNDVRFGARMLVKTPAFTAIAVLALALGIGASTTTFSVVNALLLKPWPYIQDQDRILYVSEYFPNVSSDHDNGVAYPDYLDFKQQATTLEGFGTTSTATTILSDGEKPDRYLGAFITADAFSFLGVKPVLGRTFRADEDRQGATPVALLGYEIWQNHFGSDANIIGRVVTINGKRVTVVGVMPKGWRFPEASDLWMPLRLEEKENPRGNFNFACFAKMKRGVSIEQVRAELQAIAARIAADHPQTNAGGSVRVKFFREEAVKDAKTLTLLLMGAVLFVHLITCSNVANLLLARGASRAREIGIRLALGAGRRVIIRQLLSEAWCSASLVARSVCFSLSGESISLCAPFRSSCRTGFASISTGAFSPLRSGSASVRQYCLDYSRRCKRLVRNWSMPSRKAAAAELAAAKASVSVTVWS